MTSSPSRRPHPVADFRPVPSAGRKLRNARMPHGLLACPSWLRHASTACLALALAACGTLSPVATDTGVPTHDQEVAQAGGLAPAGPAGDTGQAATAAGNATEDPSGVEMPEATLAGLESPPTGTTIVDGDELVHVEEPGALEPVGNLWDRIRAGFALPPLDSPLVAVHERSLLARPDYLERMIERSRPYLFHIVDEAERRGLPTELALLPFIESAMNPGATSHAKAAGLWQFIPSTGRAYDLKQNWWVDNRRDIVESTRAAFDYLEYIYEFNDRDWFLALASYNWGEGAVARARRASRKRGQPDDYLHLRMPRETRHYVPKLIALRNLVERAESLSLPLAFLPDKPYFVTIDRLRPMDLELAARFADMSVEEFVALNPAHHRPVISVRRNHGIVLPADRLAGFLEAVREHESRGGVFASWQPFTLGEGDTLERVAARYSVPVQKLRKANGLRPGTTLLAGSRILVPHAHVADETRIQSFAGARLVEHVKTPARHVVVRRGETLAHVARRTGTSVTRLRQLNGLGSNVTRTRQGARLLVRPAATSTVVTNEKGERRVVASRAAAAPAAGTPRTTAAPAAKTPVRPPPGRAAPERTASAASPSAAAGRNQSPDTRPLRVSTEEQPGKRRVSAAM